MYHRIHLVLFLLIAFLYANTALAEEKDVVIPFSAVSEIQPTDKVAATINDARVAIGYALQERPEIVSELTRVREKYGYMEWKVRASMQPFQADGKRVDLWQVYFRSVGFIPRFECVATFYPEGEFVANIQPYNYCAFNK